MNKRPLSVVIISCVFIAVGTVGLAYHATDFKRQGPFQYEVALICLVRLMAIVAGVFMLRGQNWARWLATAWLAYHVILSAFHSVSQTLTHAVLLAVIAYFLFRPRVSAYFRAAHAPYACRSQEPTK